MAGENQYISPIIDAFLRRRQQDLQRQQEATANEQKQASLENENKYREALIKEAGERLSEAHDEHQRQMDLLAQAHEAASLTAKTNTLKGLQEAVRNAPPGKADEAAGNYLKALGGTFTPKGGNPPTIGGEQLPGSPNATGTFPIPGEGQSAPLNISALSNAQDINANAGEKATLVQAPKSKAQLDLDAQKAQERDQLRIDSAKDGLEKALAVEQTKGTNQAEIQRIRNQGQQAIANTHGQYTLQHARVLMGEDPNLSPQAAGIAADHAANLYFGKTEGTTKNADLSKADKLSLAHYADTIGSEVPSDSIGAIVNTYAGVGPIYKQAEDIARQYSADAPKGSRVAAAVGGNPTGSLTGIGKEIQGKVQQLNAQAARLAAQNDPQARLIGSVLAGQTGAVFDPSRTVAQNIDNINKIKHANQETFENAMSGIPKPVVDAVKAKKGILTWESPVHPSNPNAIYNPTLSKQAGKDVWDLPGQAQNPNPSQSPNAQPVPAPGLPSQGVQ
jgi:hypothetical protein